MHRITAVPMVLCAAGLLSCPTTPRPEAGPWQLRAAAPRRGSVQGGTQVFVEIALGAGARPLAPTTLRRLPVACRFGPREVAARWDDRTHRHVCTAPAHPHPEPVGFGVRVGGRLHPKGRFVYTTEGKQDLPLLQVRLGPILHKSRALRKQLPARVKYGVVLKKTEPIGALGAALARRGAADWLFVSSLHDGVRLRRAGVKKPVVVLFAVDPERALELLHYDLQAAALSVQWVRRATRALRGAPGPLGVHLWIDTGLGRQGVMPGQAVALARAVAASPKLQLRGISTHLCCVTDADGAALAAGDASNRTVQQKRRFDGAVQAIRAAGLGRDALLHVGASDVVRFGLTGLHYDLVRVGCLLLENDRKPAPNFHWTTRVRQLKTLPKGWCLGYRCRRQTQRRTRAALLGHTPLLHLEYWIHGRPAPVLLHHGYTMLLDVTDHRRVAVGDEVRLTFRSARGSLVSDPPTPVTLIGAPD